MLLVVHGGAAGIEDSSGVCDIAAPAGKDTSGGEVGPISGDGGGAGSGGFVAGSESGMSFDPAMRALESGWCPGAQILIPAPLVPGES